MKSDTPAPYKIEVSRIHPLRWAIFTIPVAFLAAVVWSMVYLYLSFDRDNTFDSSSVLRLAIGFAIILVGGFLVSLIVAYAFNFAVFVLGRGPLFETRLMHPIISQLEDHTFLDFFPEHPLPKSTDDPSIDTSAPEPLVDPEPGEPTS